MEGVPSFRRMVGARHLRHEVTPEEARPFCPVRDRRRWFTWRAMLHAEFVFSAIQSRPVELFEPLMWRLWEDAGILSAEIFQHLLKRDRRRALRDAKQSLEQLHEIRAQASGPAYAPDVNLIASMLDAVTGDDPHAALQIVKRNIERANVHDFPTFARYILRNRNEAYVDPLFARLHTEWNPHVYLEVTKVLLDFDDPEIHRRLRRASQRNQALRSGWGAQAFEALLREHEVP